MLSACYNGVKVCVFRTSLMCVTSCCYLQQMLFVAVIRVIIISRVHQTQ